MQVEDYNTTEEELDAEYDSIPEYESDFRIFCERLAILIGLHGILFVAFGGSL